MWAPLTKTDILSRVTSAEQSALASAAKAAGQPDPLDEVTAQAAAEWRGALRRVTTLDRRPLAVPSEVRGHILADIRWRAWTRLPGMQSFLDDARREEWQRANTIRDSLSKLSFEPPDPANAEPPSSSGKASPSVSDPDTRALLGW